MMNSYFTQISGDQKTIKRYCKSTRIINVNWLFVGMHYVQISKKSKHACLMITSNARLKNVPTSFELVRISNHISQEMTEANSWKDCSKLFQPSEKSCGMMIQSKQNSCVRYFSALCVII